MTNISIWPGSSSFFPGDTPFGFYDNDTSFNQDADKVADWFAKRLGYPLVDIELQAINFFTCFEEAVNEYGSQLYHFQIINNFHTLEGTPSGSNLNNKVITPNLGNTVNISEQYGSETDGAGGNYKLEKGTLEVSTGIQQYDLLTHTSSSISGSEDVYMKKIYHYQPAAINRYFDPYAGTGTGIQSLMESFGFGNYSPGVNFMLMPMYFDVLKLQAIELNDHIRKSSYHFELNSGKFLRLFPIPTRDYKLWFEYTMADSSTSAAYEETDPEVEKPTNTITDISNAPYERPTYAFINEPGRQWIKKYCLAIVKEMLGSVRGKYQTVPIPGSETTLDHSRLLDEARTEKAELVELLRLDLEATTTLKQAERSTAESEQTQAQYTVDNPYQIYIH